ncbi:MAG TPA: hypothetical protein VGB20_00925, partial [bacterium]
MNETRRGLICTTAAALLALAAPALYADEAVKVDSRLMDYQRVSGVSGSVNSIGSDTLNNLMT